MFLNSVPWIPNPIIALCTSKGFIFQNCWDLLYSGGENTTEGGERGRHILQDKKNIQETIFFSYSCSKYIQLSISEKKREKKKHALYNSGEGGGGVKEGQFVYKREERFYKRQEMRTEYQNRFINYIMILQTVVTETSKHRCGKTKQQTKINSVTTKENPQTSPHTHRRRVPPWRVRDSERHLYVQFD